LGHTKSIVEVPFPEFNESFLVEEAKNYPVSFNGKMRFTLSLSLTLDKEAIQKAVLDDLRTQEYLEGKAPKKWIIVPNKIINIVF
jgi:leucyl-tRNA synthetase